jgi:ribosomal-protein-alanine N-acetyltransferase
VIVETQRLLGEPLRVRHAELLRPLLEDERVGRTLGGVLTPKQIREQCRYLQQKWQRDGFGYWVWREKATGALIGRGGLGTTHVGGRDEVEIGWAVMADRWGEGFATEMGRASARHAFGRLGLIDVVAFTLVDNVASRRVMEKLGFAHERDVLHAAMPHALYRLTPAALRD